MLWTIVAAALTGGLWQSGSQETARSVKDEVRRRVLVKIEDTRLSDVDRARLAEILADDVPTTDWPTVRVRPHDSVESLIDRYYDVYRTTTKQLKYSILLPKTTASLARLIHDANGDIATQLQTGGELRIPPVPVRTMSGQVGNTFRVFDSRAAQYAMRSGSSEWVVAKAGQPAAALNQVRASGATFVEVSPTAAAAMKSIAPAQRDVQYVRVILHQAPPCAPADPRIDQSPYMAAAKARVARALASAAITAANRRLALLDFDFPGGHASRVRAAAEWMLVKLGARDLTSFIDSIEMNKKVSATDLSAALTDYDQWNTTNHQDDTFGFAEASMWLLRATAVQPSNAEYLMPSMAIAAPLWKYMNKGDWLSLSWQVDSVQSVQPANLKDLLSSRNTFVSVSAGNDAGELRADLFPQSGGSLFSQFVNVTYGDADGRARGSITSTRGGGKVDLLAVGCGVTFKALKPADAGSSFATPIVAASAWLRSLIDGTSPSAMRIALLDAVLLAPPTSPKTTVAGGVFDPARLLAPFTMHYLDKARQQLVELSDASLNAGSCGTYKPYRNTARGLQDFIVYQQHDKNYLLYRHHVSDFPGVRVEDPCELSSLDFVAQSASGPVTASSPTDFIAKIGHLTF